MPTVGMVELASLFVLLMGFGLAGVWLIERLCKKTIEKYP